MAVLGDMFRTSTAKKLELMPIRLHLSRPVIKLAGRHKGPISWTVAGPGTLNAEHMLSDCKLCTDALVIEWVSR